MAVRSEGEVTGRSGGTVGPAPALPRPTERTPLLSSRARRAGGRRPGSTWSNVRARAASERARRRQARFSLGHDSGAGGLRCCKQKENDGSGRLTSSVPAALPGDLLTLSGVQGYQRAWYFICCQTNTKGTWRHLTLVCGLHVSRLQD